MIRLIIFDMGGVVVKFDESEYYRYLSRKVGISAPQLEKVMMPHLIRMEAGKLELDDFTEIVCNRLRIPKRDLEWDSSLKKLAATNVELEGMIRRLRKTKKYRIAMLSNVSDTRYMVFVKNFFNRRLFDKIFTSYEMGIRKPDGRIYRRVLKHFNVKPKEAVFIDNLQENVNGARAVGINAIRFVSYPKLEKSLARLGISV